MSIILATKTLAAIDAAIEEDGGARFRALEQKYLPLMDDAYRKTDAPFRTHLGVSMIGRECARELWYNFKWATPPTFPPRILRLFNRGHLEEARFLSLLEMIGVQVWEGPEKGGQFKVHGYRGHFGSALDGICKGVPDFPNIPMLAEFKTSGDKPFKTVLAKGVKEAKWEHFVQMQVCMGAYSLEKALYMVVNKNDDELYAEIIEYDHGIACQYNERASLIIEATEPPLKLSKTPSFFKCRFCNYKQVCHFGEGAERTCRSCIHSSPDEDGTWFCAFNKSFIPFETQLTGCSEYEYNEIFNFPV